MKHISNLAEEVINHKRNVVPTGFRFLDEAFGGYHGGQLTTIIGNEIQHQGSENGHRYAS